MKGLRKWPWKELPAYNGFTHVERIRGWQLINFLFDNGLKVRPSICSVSGSTERIQIHSENYYGWEPFAISQSIHLALHRRFGNLDSWQAIVNRYAVTGEEWFARLPLTPTDLAGQLRAEHGLQIVDVFRHLSKQFNLAALPTSDNAWSDVGLTGP